MKIFATEEQQQQEQNQTQQQSVSIKQEAAVQQLRANQQRVEFNEKLLDQLQEGTAVANGILTETHLLSPPQVPHMAFDFAEFTEILVFMHFIMKRWSNSGHHQIHLSLYQFGTNSNL